MRLFIKILQTLRQKQKSAFFRITVTKPIYLPNPNLFFPPKIKRKVIIFLGKSLKEKVWNTKTDELLLCGGQIRALVQIRAPPRKIRGITFFYFSSHFSQIWYYIDRNHLAWFLYSYCYQKHLGKKLEGKNWSVAKFKMATMKKQFLLSFYLIIFLDNNKNIKKSSKRISIYISNLREI